MEHDENFTEIDSRLTGWFQDVVAGIACTVLDGHSVLPLHGLLPPLGEDAAALVAVTIAAEAIAWTPPAVRLLAALDDAPAGAQGLARMSEDVVDGAVAGLAPAAELTVQRWSAVAALVAVLPGADCDELAVAVEGPQAHWVRGRVDWARNRLSHGGAYDWAARDPFPGW